MKRQEAVSYLLARAAELDIEIEVLADESRSLSVEAFEGRVSELKQATRGGIGVRAVVGGRVGYAWSEELETAALDWVLSEARENALLREESGAELAVGGKLGDTDLLSEGLSAPLDAKVRQAVLLESELRRDPRFHRTATVRYHERETSRSIASTRGVEGGYRSGAAGLLSSFVMKEGESVKQGGGFDAEKEFHRLEPGRTALKMLERTGRLLGARSLPTGRYRAYLEPEVVADLLGVLQFALSGKALVEGKSAFAGRLGERVASELVTLVDDPRHPEGLGNRPFDSEGTAGNRLTIIERGTLHSFLHNSATARRSAQENTGHAARSYRGTLGVAPSNLLLLPGDGVEPRDGVLVTELMGLHAGANPISGDLSLQALGLRYLDGESHPVENFVMSGNLFALLMRVSALGREPEWVHAADVQTPMMQIEGVSFAGA